MKPVKHKLDTPRDGKAWCDVVNKEPLPVSPTRKAMAIGSCNANGAGFKPYAKPIVRDVPTGSYLWLGDFKL